MNAQDLFRLDGRVAFLSGAAGHLGREMARALGHAGATLIFLKEAGSLLNARPST